MSRLFPGEVEVLDSGCCGMAGSFGYMPQNYDLSMRIGEQSLFSALRARGVAHATEAPLVIAPGTRTIVRLTMTGTHSHNWRAALRVACQGAVARKGSVKPGKGQSLHARTDFRDKERRLMRRVAIKGERPV
jgi:hypothetical protein